ncbi:Hypothetical protein FBFL15_1955 [Flavobacterium branchiophilum FL-15]|uniref:Uncharacterized protein n=2 Tax=Flavobacterium branchiophilum TaxID=55197 RepID=G2Z249_FLABF|nr:Hypothetical protein FBFL15_1955 [Flavobacterium branchiophilum FL-15]
MLPILCILYLKNINAFKQYSSIDIHIWDGKEYHKEITTFLKSKKIYHVNLTGDNKTDKIKLNNAEKTINKLIISNDSLIGVKFHFEKKSEYWTFIRVLEILAIEKAEFYLLYKNDIWFANPSKPKPNKNPIRMMTCSYRPIHINRNERENQLLNIEEIEKKYYLPIIAYLLLIFFTFKNYYK